MISFFFVFVWEGLAQSCIGKLSHLDLNCQIPFLAHYAIHNTQEVYLFIGKKKKKKKKEKKMVFKEYFYSCGSEESSGARVGVF